MTNSERNRRWYDRYNREVNNMTTYYERLNAAAPVITRKPTPEEIEFYNNVINKLHHT